MVITTSSNVSNFDVKITLDISTSTAKAIIEDISTYIGAGAANIIGINIKAISPANLTFHETIYPPDVDIQPGLTDVEFNLPVFNSAVVWGTYKFYATLIDQDGTEYVWTENGVTYKSVTICKPNTLEYAKGNLGGLDLEPDFDCNTLVATVGDATPYSYKGQSPFATEVDLVVSFPADTTGFIQTIVADFVPFTFQFNISGTYTISGQVTQTYKFSDTTFVKAGYFYSNTFEVQCQYSLCNALCDFKNLREEVKQCATMSPALAQDKQRKLTLINSLIIEAKLLNNCGVDNGNILEQIKVIGGFECNCNCDPQGLNGLALPIGADIEEGTMCGDISMSVTQLNNVFKVNLSDVSYSMGVDDDISDWVSFQTNVSECAKQFVLSIDFCAAVEALGCGSGGGGVTIYTGDSSLTGNRTVTQAGFSLTFTEDVTIGGKLTVGGLIDPTGMYLDEQVADHPAVANKGVLYTKDDTGITQLFYRASDGTVNQITPTTLGTFITLSDVIPTTPDSYVGLAGKVWRVNVGETGLEPVTIVSGFADPMTTIGDMIYRNTSNVTARLPVGTLGQTMASLGGTAIPAWSSFLFNNGSNVGVNIQSGFTGTLHIKGSGTTLSTTSLYTQNSDGTKSLQFRDDGVILRDGILYSIYDNTNANTTWGRLAGNGFTVGSATGNSLFGHTAGQSITTASSCVIIGASAGVALTTGGSHVFIGTNAGLGTTDGTNNIFIGVGTGLTNTSGYCHTLVGTGANVASNNLNSSIGLGQSTTITASNQFVAGSGSFKIADVYIGAGVTHTGNTTITYHGSGGSGADSIGANVVWASGQSTGAAVPSLFIIQSTVAGVSSSTAQTLADTVTITKTLMGIGITPTKGYLEIKAGTTTIAPLVLTSGTNNTTAQAGAIEYNGTNFLGTRTGTTRQTILTANVVTTEVIVSDTTITVNVAGTDYKILARA